MHTYIHLEGIFFLFFAHQLKWIVQLDALFQKRLLISVIYDIKQIVFPKILIKRAFLPCFCVMQRFGKMMLKIFQQNYLNHMYSVQNTASPSHDESNSKKGCSVRKIMVRSDWFQKLFRTLLSILFLILFFFNCIFYRIITEVVIM